jgi:hypothetical protein
MGGGKMHGHITRTLLVAAAAGATITAMGSVAAGTAGAATHTALPKIYTNVVAGYIAIGNGQRFQHIETSLKVPPRQPIAGNNAPAAISLIGGRTHTEAIVVAAGGGARSVSYVTAHGGKAFSLSPRVGDTLKISITYNQSTHRDRFVATNTRTGRTVAVTLATGGKVNYTQASFEAAIQNSRVHNPAHDIRLWAFSNSLLTNYSGHRYTILGPWLTFNLIDTTTGTPRGKVVMSPSSLWNGGRNFGIYLRHR